jgi:Uma2 family endonuclease
MSTVTKLGPADHGRAMTFEEYLAGDYEQGYQYELIDGRLYVSPQANAPQGHVERWLYRKLDRYADDHAEILNYVYNKTRVFVPGRPDVTTPEPDIAAYTDYPLHLPVADVNWEDVSPVLVVEIVSADDPAKDLIRNVALYREVPSIREYWVVDGRADPDRPEMRVYRRRGRRWQRVILVRAGATYTTRFLPGFTLVLDPHR